MKKILDTVIVGGYTAQDVLIVVGVATVFLIILQTLMRVFKKEKSGKYYQFVDCLNCGWHGKVSTFAGRCPKCNQPLGEQKARRIK